MRIFISNNYIVFFKLSFNFLLQIEKNYIANSVSEIRPTEGDPRKSECAECVWWHRTRRLTDRRVKTKLAMETSVACRPPNQSDVPIRSF